MAMYDRSGRCGVTGLLCSNYKHLRNARCAYKIYHFYFVKNAYIFLACVIKILPRWCWSTKHISIMCLYENDCYSFYLYIYLRIFFSHQEHLPKNKIVVKRGEKHVFNVSFYGFHYWPVTTSYYLSPVKRRRSLKKL